MQTLGNDIVKKSDILPYTPPKEMLWWRLRLNPEGWNRMEQLQEEVGAAQKEVTGLKASLAAAKADNVALYEKIRFLQRFGQRTGEPASGIVIKVDGAGVPQGSVRGSPHPP